MSELHPYRATIRVTLVAEDGTDASEEYDRLVRALPSGFNFEGGECERMKPGEVISGSPLDEWLKG